MNGMKIPNVPVITGRPLGEDKSAVKIPAGTGTSFGEILGRKLQEQTRPQTLVFSKHAAARSQQRGVTLSQADMQRLSNAIDRAGDKGITDTLVYMDNTAFIVNVPSKVVVTVVNGEEAGDTVFTNIDGAVIV